MARPAKTQVHVSRAAAPPLAGARVVLVAIATALAVAGGTWIALQPAVTHSDLDGALSGSLLRLYLYLPPTLVGVWLSARFMDRAWRQGPGPVITALLLAAPAVMAGTLAEVLARLTLGHGDVLALDGVLQRIIELIRVDVPTCALAAVVLARRHVPIRHAALTPAHPPGPRGHRP